MGALANPYVLVVLLAISAGYTVTEKVKAPVKKAAHAVVHVLTGGKH